VGVAPTPNEKNGKKIDLSLHGHGAAYAQPELIRLKLALIQL